MGLLHLQIRGLDCDVLTGLKAPLAWNQGDANDRHKARDFRTLVSPSSKYRNDRCSKDCFVKMYPRSYGNLDDNDGVNVDNAVDADDDAAAA